MYEVSVNVFVNNNLQASYVLRGLDRMQLFSNAISYFRGYVQAYTDCRGIEMYSPAVMSLDGFRSWSKTRVHRIELLNKDRVVICNSTDIE